MPHFRPTLVDQLTIKEVTVRTIKKPAAALAILLSLSACGGGGDGGVTDAGGDEPGAEAVEVTAQNFAFQPTHIPASEGDTLAVSVTNKDETDHTFTIEEIDVDVVIEPGASEDVEFTVSEVPLGFVCRFHPAMTGTIGGDQAD